MQGYIKRNDNGVKEIREGDVRPPRDLNYMERHTMSNREWGWYWEVKIKWDSAKIIGIYPAVYWAFPEEEGKVEYDLFGMWAVPAGFDTNILFPKRDKSAMHRKFERALYNDGGYSARRDANDGGL